MSWKLRLLILAVLLTAAWVFRHDYRTKTLKDVTCVERINRFTSDRCLYSGDVEICTRVAIARVCD